MFWGIALIWASFDALQWQAFVRNATKELAFVVAPLAIGMFSPRRLAVRGSRAPDRPKRREICDVGNNRLFLTALVFRR
jgi:hypothetical protein